MTAHPVGRTKPVILPEPIAAALHAGAWAVFNLSGGKDSSAALFATSQLLDAMGHPRERRLAIHADLGRAEWETTPAMVERIAAQAGLPLIVVSRAAGDLFDRWQQRFDAGKRRYEALETYNLIGPWSSSSLRFCTSEFKAQVIGPDLARRLRGETIINVIGIRRDESSARAAAPEWKADTRFAAAGNRHGTKMMVWHPIVDWSTTDVFSEHHRLGIPLHEAYTTYGSTRVSCRFCIMQAIGDIRASASAPANHEALLHLVDLEAASTFSFQPARWLADVAPQLIPASLGARVELAKHHATARRSAEAALPPGLRFDKGWPPRLPTTDEASAIAATRAPILALHDLANHYPTAAAVVDRFKELIALRNDADGRRRHRPTLAA